MSFITDVMQAAVQIQIKYGLPAACLTAQVCLETGYGKYVCKDINTGQYSYNLFNIKGKGPAGSVYVKTWEVYNGVSQTVYDYFCAYNDYEESFAGYVKLITGSSRYAPCVAAKDDPDEYARQLQRCGYATDPAYPTKLINIMNANSLKEMANELYVGGVIMLLKNFNAPIEPWEPAAVQSAMVAGLLANPHDPREIVTYSEFSAIMLNLLNILKGGM